MKFSDTGSFSALDKRKRERTSVRTRDFLRPRRSVRHMAIQDRNLSSYSSRSVLYTHHYRGSISAQSPKICLVKMGKQEYVLMPRHGEACDRQQSQCNDYVLITSNKQITVFEFLMFMRLNNRFTFSGAVQINVSILMEILDHWYLPVSYAD